MSDVFISYKREDEARVQRLYDALVRAGLTVWWDREIEGGSAWRQRILEEIDTARCVIVVWSQASVGENGAFVRDEAARGLERKILLPLRIDKVSPPLGFGEYQALDLVDWRGDAKDLRIQDVVASARAVVARQPRPRPTWPTWRRRRTFALSAMGATPVAVVLALLLQPALHRTVCALPGIRRLCDSPEDCFKWVPRQRMLGLPMEWNKQPFPSEEEAKADTLRQAAIDAQLVCPSGDGTLTRLVDAGYEVKELECTSQPDGHRCSLKGLAICKSQERVRAFAGECEP